MTTPRKTYPYLDLASIRARLDASRGREYWRSLEELANTEGFEELLEREFPRQASEWKDDAAGRRQFLKVMGASLALAGLSACTRQPTETIMPYVRQPEEVIPGKPLFFATAVPNMAVAMGVLVESHLGRPTKIEGNPEHPASLGSTDATAQAAVLDLYDPDRSQTLTYLGDIRPWSSFLGAAREALGPQSATGGAGLRFLTGATTSPTLADQFHAVLQKFPKAKWHRYEPAGRHASRAAARQAFSRTRDGHDDVRKCRPRVIQIVLRRPRGMIRVRMIEAQQVAAELACLLFGGSIIRRPDHETAARPFFGRVGQCDR